MHLIYSMPYASTLQICLIVYDCYGIQVCKLDPKLVILALIWLPIVQMHYS